MWKLYVRQTRKGKIMRLYSIPAEESIRRSGKSCYTLLFVMTLFFALLFFTPVTAFADDSDSPVEMDITVGGPAVSCGKGVYELYFTASSDSGYTVTIDAPDYMLTDLYFYGEDPEYGDYDILHYEMGLNVIDYGSITGANSRRISSFYGTGGRGYMLYLRNSYADGFNTGTAKVTVTKSDKAGLTSDGFEYWSSNETGVELAEIIGYTGNASVVTVPGKVGDLRVSGVASGLFAGDSNIEKLVFSEGINLLRNNVAANCPNLREVVLPSTFNEDCNAPFQGCQLDSITFPKGNPEYSYKDHCLIYWGTSLRGYYGTASDFTVPDGIEHVASKAFTGSTVSIIRHPDSVKRFFCQFHYFDEIHVAASYCDITDQQWFNEYEGDIRYLGTVYGKHNSLTEQQTGLYGRGIIKFVVEGGEAQKVYPVKPSGETFIYQLPSSSVYRYAPDDHYYGTFTAPETGKYVFWANSDGYPEFDYISDSKGTKYQFKDFPETEGYENDVCVQLTKGERYTFCMSDIGEQFWGNEKKADYFDVYIQTPSGVKAYYDYYYESDNSQPAAVTPAAPVKTKTDLPAVRISKPKAAKKAMTVKWKKVSKKNQKKIASIQIQYSTDKTFRKGVKTVTAKKSSSSKKIKKLTSKKTYYVRIRAYKKAGNVIHVSKWSAVKKVKVK